MPGPCGLFDLGRFFSAIPWWCWGAAFVLAFFGSLALVAVLLVWLPADYFVRSESASWLARRTPAVRWTLRIGKNLIGLVLIVMGVVMLFTPGQGLLSILLGVMLLDFPGKHKLERKLLKRPGVQTAINRLRARFGKPPLVVQASEQGEPLPEKQPSDARQAP